MRASTAGSALITAQTANKHREEERRRREGQRAARLERSEGNTAKLKRNAALTCLAKGQIISTAAAAGE